MKRIPAAGTVFLLAALALAAACSSRPTADASGMNLLVITLDTTRADVVGLYGNPHGATPNIDELGRAGLVFKECYTPAPLTLPAHCSLFTGRYPLGHGVRNNGTYALPASVPAMARLFKERGYETAAVVASFTVAAKFGLAQGFDSYEEDFESGRSILNFTAEIPADKVYGKFARWLDRRPGGKFFGWVHFYDAHSPYVPHGEPGSGGSATPWQLYEGEVRFVDAHVGKIVQALRDKGLYENTLIVVVGDHGEGFGEHKEQGHGIFCYEESLRVPLILHAPRLFKQPKTVAGRVSLVDIMPSLLELFGVKAPAAVQGRSFWALADGREKGRREIYFESLFGQEEYNWAPLTGLIDGPRKYISLPEPELYDIEADPGEKADLFAARSGEAREIDKKLETFIRRTATAEKGGGRRELSSSDTEKLKSLGYISSFGSKSAAVMDPKRGIDVYLEVVALKDLLRRKDYENAEERLAAVLAKYPAIELPDIYEIRYEVLKKNGRLAEAIDLLQKGLARFPERESFKIFLAMDMIESGDPARAREFCLGLLAENERMTSALILLGEAEDLLHNTDAALADCEKAAALEPQNGAVQAKIAALLIKKGDPARAGKILESLEGRKDVVDSPEFMEAMSGLAQVLLAAGETDKAIELYRKAADLVPASPAVWLNLGGAYFSLKRYGPALENFEKSVALDKKFALGYSNIGMVYLSRLVEEREPALAEKALGYFNKAIDLEPGLAAAWNGRASLLLATGQTGPAVADYERAIKLDPYLLDAFINISIALREEGRPAEALKYLDICKERLYPRLSERDRQDIDRLYGEIKARIDGR